MFWLVGWLGWAVRGCGAERDWTGPARRGRRVGVDGHAGGGGPRRDERVAGRGVKRRAEKGREEAERRSNTFGKPRQAVAAAAVRHHTQQTAEGMDRVQSVSLMCDTTEQAQAWGDGNCDVMSWEGATFNFLKQGSSGGGRGQRAEAGRLPNR